MEVANGVIIVFLMNGATQVNKTYSTLEKEREWRGRETSHKNT